MNIEITPEIKEAKQRFGIIGNSPALMAAVGRALQVAPIDLSVLINGESGAGKEFFPQIIHAYSSRKHSKYIAVNCGAIPEGTIDSELCGHEKGAFTGAISSRKGYFEEANGGTIFLDEVAELPLDLHGKATDEGLWRWLKHRVVPRHRAYRAQFLSRLGIRNGDLRGQSFLDMKSEFQLRYRQKLAQRCRWNDVNLAQRERTL